MTDIINYLVTVEPLSDKDGGGSIARIPVLPGCMGDGETEAQAIADVREAAMLYILAYQKRGQAVPRRQSGRTRS